MDGWTSVVAARDGGSGLWFMVMINIWVGLGRSLRRRVMLVDSDDDV